MPEKIPSPDRLLKKFFSGTASAEERSLLWKWIWRLDVQDESREEDPSLIRERLWARIQPATQSVSSIPARRNWKPLLAAASLVTVIFAGWALARHRNGKQELSASTVISNAENRVRQLTLPDGTKAILDIHSKLRYASSYNDKERRVYLDGEGYFMVYKDDHRPFIVQTGEVETMALGTAINIESRSKEGQIRVALTEGKIAVSLAGNQTQKELLSPGQILFYDKTRRNFTTSQYTTDVTAWVRGGLVFNNVPLKEALDRLAERYQLEMRYDVHRLEGHTITSSFGNIGWKDILSDVCLLHNLTWHEKNKKIIIE